MNLDLRRRRLVQAGLLSGLPGLAGPARACEFFSPVLRITHPWTRATPEGATSAVVSMKFDEVAEDERLIGVLSPVATGAELGCADGRRGVDLFIPKGQATQLGEQGLFLRLLGLTQPLEVGRTFPLQLMFEKGGTVRADLTVDYARFL